TLFQGSADDLVVDIAVAPAAMPLVADYIPEDAVSTEVDGRIQTSVRVSHYHGLKRLVTGLPGVVTVLGPADARQVVSSWAAAGAARYGDS
ncbi:MAG: DeoR family transcriptional regulator, partial [Microbacteriaceae bacterium]|nr:DeoR family transcriptional regulator [Microbacteriaceae bacterium]